MFFFLSPTMSMVGVFLTSKIFTMNYIAVPTELIYDTPNDMELGAKVRELYFELTTKTEEHEN